MSPPAQMRQLEARDLIATWEGLSSEGPLRAAGALLAAASARTGSMADLPVGQRDGLLLELRRSQLGDAIELVASCPACGTEVETTVSCASLTAAVRQPGPSSWEIEAEGYRVRVRCVRAADQIAAASAANVGAAREELVARAVLAVTRQGTPVTVAEIPESVIAAVGASVLDHDPLADIGLVFGCPDCRQEWRETLDAPRLVVTELAARGRAVLAEVDLLARTYGWTEDIILGLAPARRATYVSLAGGSA